MSKFRALLVSSLLATAVLGGTLSLDGAAEAKAPITSARDTTWCC